jgi:hypothetical protein
MAVENGSFRGVEVNRLARLVENACGGARLSLMKSANVTANLGKEPFLVLAEQLILALREEEQGAQYDD